MRLLDGTADAPCKLVLAHGSGQGMESPFLSHLAEAVAAANVAVVRFEFPYMQKSRAEGKRKPPDRAPILLDTWRDVITEERTAGQRFVIGGRSMGGRIASMLADECGVDGLICYGYPFHPPGKPERLRTEHLGPLKTPTLICQGTRDTFGNETEVPGYALSDSIGLHWLPDGDHGFKPRKSAGVTERENWDSAVAATLTFLAALSP